MKGKAKRIGGVAMLALVLVGGSAVSATAQMQYVQSRPVRGSYAWHSDNWYYQQQGGRWVRTGYRRVFPNPANPHVYDIYASGQFLKRVDTSQPGWVKELPAANLAASSVVSWTARQVNTTATEANTWFLIKASNQWTTVARLRAAQSQAQAPAAGGVQTGNFMNTLGGVTGPVITIVNPSGVNVTAEATKLGGYNYGPIR